MTQPNTHDTIVIEWDETGKVTYCRTFDYPSDEGNMRAAIATLNPKNRFHIGKAESILHLSKFKEDTE